MSKTMDKNSSSVLDSISARNEMPSNRLQNNKVVNGSVPKHNGHRNAVQAGNSSSTTGVPNHTGEPGNVIVDLSIETSNRKHRSSVIVAPSLLAYQSSGHSTDYQVDNIVKDSKNIGPSKKSVPTKEVNKISGDHTQFSIPENSQLEQKHQNSQASSTSVPENASNPLVSIETLDSTTLDWQDELNKYWSAVEKQTKSSLHLIKLDRIRKGLAFDDQFQDEILHSTNSRIRTAFKQFMIQEPFHQTGNNTGVIEQNQAVRSGTSAVHTQNYELVGRSKPRVSLHEFGDQSRPHQANISINQMESSRAQIRSATEITIVDDLEPSATMIDDAISPYINQEIQRVVCPDDNFTSISIETTSEQMFMQQQQDTDDVSEVIDLVSDCEENEHQCKNHASTDMNAVNIPPQSTVHRQQKRKRNNATVIGNPKKKSKLAKKKGSEKRFKCADCTYSTDIKRNLCRHAPTHTIERPYECKVCEKRFKECRSLNRHIKTHTELFEFQCSKCRKGFSQQEQCKSHENCCKIKAYECYLCRKKFYQRSDNFMLHMRCNHTGDKPFSCTDCPNRFFTKFLLSNHIKRHHKKDN